MEGMLLTIITVPYIIATDLGKFRFNTILVKFLITTVTLYNGHQLFRICKSHSQFPQILTMLVIGAYETQECSTSLSSD